MLTKILRYGEGRTLKRLNVIAKHVESLDAEMSALSDEQLQEKTVEFKKRLADGEDLDDILVEAFAVAREASYRILKQKHFHVQIMGGAALHFGNIAEMRTGEGKTLTCVLPAYLNALSGKGVHVVTTNDYLARRDAEWMGRIHRFLGLTVDVISPDQDQESRRNAYRADITYGTNNEFGFDYLRDNMVRELSSVVQNGHNYAIVDEVDSILIDEARTPLIISGPAETSSKWYTEFARIAKKLNEDVHYEVDLRKRAVGITEAGVAEVENQLGIDNLYETNNAPLVSYLNNALKAIKLFERDKDYIVSDGEVIIVDEFTGRMLHGRRFNEGLHQAIEAKEGVEIKAENQTLATITLQNYFRLYDKLAGMTGTAQTEAAEFHQIYKLGVISIPTNKPVLREDKTDLIYRTEVAKFNAVVDDVIECHNAGQPVLIGTASVERSEYLSQLLTKHGIAHNVLNAKNHENEASIIARAGLPGAVTVATNMAGRGTDIVLGGNIDIIADEIIRASGLDPVHQEHEYQLAWEKVVAEVTEKAELDAEKVRRAGGLYVIGTEHHDSRRIDNQLRGRTGRQGDPGHTRFFLSVQDELIRRFNGAMLEMMMQKLGIPEEVPIDQKMITRALKSAQTQVEQLNFEIRKDVLKYDEVMNQQRLKVYSERNTILRGDDLRPTILAMIEDVIKAYVKGATAQGYSEDWDLDTLWGALDLLYPISLRYEDIFGSYDEHGERKDISAAELQNLIIKDAKELYEKKITEIAEITGDPNNATVIERTILLTILDQKWQEHLYEMDYLKEGISLRAMAQRDPLVEYQREGFTLFQGMIDALKEETVRTLFSVQVLIPETEPAHNPDNTDNPVLLAGQSTTGSNSGLSLESAQDAPNGMSKSLGATSQNDANDASEHGSSATAAERKPVHAPVTKKTNSSGRKKSKNSSTKARKR